MLGSLPATPGGTATPIVNTSQAITAASTIAIASGVANQVCPVTSAAAITLTSNPQLGTGIAGQRVTIQNAGANTITFADGNGLSLQGTLAIGSTQFATFVNLGGFWQLESTNGSPVWTPVTFQNSFVNQAGFQACEFTRFLNVVSCRGNASRSVAYSAGVVLFTLPVGFRPPAWLRFPLDEIAMPGTANTLELSTAGTLTYFSSGTPASQQISINAVSFRV